VHGQCAGDAETRLEKVVFTAGRQEVSEINLVSELTKVYYSMAESAIAVFLREIARVDLSVPRIGIYKSKKVQPAVGSKGKKVDFSEILRRKSSDQC
jgi:hypothetical protein